MMPQTHFICGLDLGQAEDYSALAVVERTGQGKNTEYGCRAIKRWTLGTTYTQIVEEVKAICGKEPLLSERTERDSWNRVKTVPVRSTLVVDGTGVGRPVVDMFRMARIEAQLAGVMITAGMKDGFVDGYWHVAKTLLISTVVALLEQGRLKFASTLRDIDLLVKE